MFRHPSFFSFDDGVSACIRLPCAHSFDALRKRDSAVSRALFPVMLSMKSVRLFPLLSLVAMSFCLCGLTLAGEALRIFVPVLPYEDLVGRIGGDLVKVTAIVQEGGDCHNYSPSPRQVADVSRAALLFSGGLTFEEDFYAAVSAGSRGPKKIDLLEGVEILDHDHDHDKIEAAEKDHDHHDHGEEADTHVWLSPRALKVQASHVATVLKENLPAAAAEKIDANLAAYTSELDRLDAEIRSMLKGKKGKAFYVYHAAFTYFAHDYELVQKSIEVGNQKPTPRQVTAIARQAKADGVTTLFVQPQFDQSSAKSLAEAIGGRVETLDPLDRDVFANLLRIAKAIAETP